MRDPGCTCVPHPYGSGVEVDCPVHGAHEWLDEPLNCSACGAKMSRRTLYAHECPELAAARARGARLLDALSVLDPDEGKF